MMSGNSGTDFRQNREEPWEIINLNIFFDGDTKEDGQEGDFTDHYYESDDTSSSDLSSVTSAERTEMNSELREWSSVEDMDWETEEVSDVFATNMYAYFSEMRDPMLSEVFFIETNRGIAETPFEVGYYTNTFSHRHLFYNDISNLEQEDRDSTSETGDSDSEDSLYSDYYEVESPECGCSCPEDLNVVWSQHEEIN
ncbi:hypothetical protein JCM33374_g5458 [Metschnikowia sp. JCM 33374]|nr:hypothetical protein JCM33374_g5458 [Metschnikowia sp. JCM 33374]